MSGSNFMNKNYYSYTKLVGLFFLHAMHTFWYFGKAYKKYEMLKTIIIIALMNKK